MVDPVVHFEIPAKNTARAKKFYEKSFGWKISYAKEFDYFLISAKDKANKMMPGIDGGMMKAKPGQPFMVYVHVKNIDAAMKKVVANGAKICMPKTAIGDMGHLAAFVDPEGNVVGLHAMGKPKKVSKKKKK